MTEQSSTPAPESNEPPLDAPAGAAVQAQEPTAPEAAAEAPAESPAPGDSTETSSETSSDTSSDTSSETAAADTVAAVEPAVVEPVEGDVPETAPEPVTEPAAPVEGDVPETAPEPVTEPAAPAPVPRPAPPKPGPIPTPAAVRPAAKAAVPAVVPPRAPGPAAETFGRVDESGVVYVRTGDGEREVGSYPGASADEALSYFARKFDELWASAELLHQRVHGTDIPAKDATEALAKLREHTTEPNVVGDLAALEAKVAEIETAVAARKEVEAAERAAARAAARVEREAIVAEAEQIAAQPENKIQWKASGARMRALLDEWKHHQRHGAKLEREAETALWQRFSHARNSFDKARRVHFAQLEGSQAEAKAAKQELVKEAEALATSKDWGPTASAFKRLMDRWRQAGRASRADDDALWERFKAAQDAFFAAKDKVAAAEDEEFRANLEVKEQLLQEAQGILPITDIDAAKAALRTIQEKWDKAGKVPRGDVDRIEKSLRRIETAVREADDKRWQRSNPEVAARAQSMVDQLESSVAGLREALAKAEASGNDKKVADAKAKLEAQETWLAQARAGLDEFGG